MQKNTTPVLWLAGLLCWVCLGQAQPVSQAIPSYPPSPQAIALGQFAEIPQGTYTGQVPIQLTLPSLETANGFELPISIDYAGGGLRVDDYPGTLGMSWTLNAGGMVSRYIQGGDDFGPRGYHNNPVQVPPAAVSDLCEWKGENYWSDLIQLSNQGKSPYTPDARPDQYNINFCGKAAKFYYRPDKMPAFIPFQNLQVLVNYQHIGNPQLQQLSWTINDEEGNTYYFSHMEINQLSFLPTGVQDPYISGALLTQIKTASGEYIDFEYEPYSYSYQQGRSYDWTIESNCGFEGKHSVQTSLVEVKTWLLKRISYKSKEILFTYTNYNPVAVLTHLVYKTGNRFQKAYRFDYTKDQQERIWLERMVQVEETPGRAANELPTWNFSYYRPEELPERLSTKQDYWGYFNSNPSDESMAPNIVPGIFLSDCNLPGASMDQRGPVSRDCDLDKCKYGSLIRIQHPTGGFTEYEWEAHEFTHPDYVYMGIKDAVRGAGLRIKEIRKLDSDESILLRRAYTYQDGLIMSIPIPYSLQYSSCGGIAQLYYSSRSGSILQQSRSANGSMVGYGSTSEFQIDADELPSGKTERHYHNFPAQQPREILYGKRWQSSGYFPWYISNGMPYHLPAGTPWINEHESRNGSLLEEKWIRTRGKEEELVKSCNYSYDTIGLGRISGTIVSFPICPTNTPWNCNEMLYIRYYHNTLYNRLSSVKTKDYARGNVQSFNPLFKLTEKRITYYNKDFHFVESIVDKDANTEQSKRFEYLAQPQAQYTINDHYRIKHTVKEEQFRNNVKVAQSEMEYNSSYQLIKKRNRSIGMQGQVLPTKPWEEIQFTYDSDNRLIASESSFGQKQQFSWDNLNQVVFAVAQRCTNENFASTGFEPEANQGWNFNSSGRKQNLSTRAGEYLYDLNAGPLRKELAPGQYRFRYWYRNGIQAPSWQIPSGALITQEDKQAKSGDWYFVQGLFKLDKTCIVSLSGKEEIDELVVHPLDALVSMTSFGAFGVLAQSDENGQITTYSYDKLGRLEIQVNHNGFVEQGIQYQLKP